MYSCVSLTLVIDRFYVDIVPNEASGHYLFPHTQKKSKTDLHPVAGDEPQPKQP